MGAAALREFLACRAEGDLLPWRAQCEASERFTPAVIASLQTAELAKILLGRGKLLADRALFVNLLDMEFDEIRHA